MGKIILLLESHIFLNILIWAVILDTILGVLRSIKEHKFNSCIGIDGAIRKVAMVLSIVVLAYIDTIVNFNMIGFIPEEALSVLGITAIGLHELFCLLYILYEAVSIMKNMALCGLPVPRLREFLMKFLDDMTDELPEEAAEELHVHEVKGE